MTSSLKERLLLAFDPHKHSQVELARVAKVTQPSVSDWFTGKTLTLKAEPMIRTALYLNVAPLWLSTGEGEMRIDALRPHWPFPGIDEEWFCSLGRDTHLSIQGGIFLQAAQMGVNLRNAEQG